MPTEGGIPIFLDHRRHMPIDPRKFSLFGAEFGHAQLQTFLHTYIYVQSNCFRSCIYICTGYFFSCSAYSIAVCVIGKRVTTANGAESVYNYYVNDGIHGSFYICSANMIQTPLVPIILQVYDICFCIDWRVLMNFIFSIPCLVRLLPTFCILGHTQTLPPSQNRYLGAKPRQYRQNLWCTYARSKHWWLDLFQGNGRL